MIDIKFTVAGKKIDPEDFADAAMKEIARLVAAQIRDRIASIRDPDTGEFPTIVIIGDDLENLSLKVEGSPKLVALVEERLGTNSDEAEQQEMPMNSSSPRVFLSYASEDLDLAKSIATTLTQNGIETWWDRWEMAAGDSLRQKIDEGLASCTHFVVLLTPRSIEKPWVKHEMDSAIVRKIGDKCKFIPLRYQLPASELPPTLAGLLSPEIESGSQIPQLISDIYGVSAKPPLGTPPAFVTPQSVDTGYSAAANAIARLFVERTEHGEFGDPQFDVGEIAGLTGITVEDAEDGLHELYGYVDVVKTMGLDNHVMVKAALYANFDQFWKPWNPADDALRLAADVLNDQTFPYACQQIAARYGWEPRRLNPAISYLLERGVILETRECGTSPYVLFGVQENDETRRFVKSCAILSAKT